MSRAKKKRLAREAWIAALLSATPGNYPGIKRSEIPYSWDNSVLASTRREP